MTSHIHEPEITPYDVVGGPQALRTLVDRFYDLMDSEPEFRTIRDMHPADMRESREKLYLFLSGWLGGPDLYVEKFGHPMLRRRHLPFPIGTDERDQWVKCMVRAMDEVSLDEALRTRLGVSFFQTADFMRNKEG